MSVSYVLQGHVAVITVDDGKANAYTHEALNDLTRSLDQAQADPDARALLLVGRPGRFSAGFDLATMTASPAAMRALVGAGGQLAARLLLEPLPVVAACTGHALAAGALMLLAADRRIGAAGEYKIGLNEVAIGMTLPIWAVELARYRMPASRLDRVILGETTGPDEACVSGFLDEVVAPDDLLEAALATATSLAALRSGAVASTKMRIRGAVAARMLDGMEEDLAGLEVPTVAGR
jgi:enoyl-CoA hydratase